NGSAIGAAVLFREDAVGGAPQKQGLNANAVQPALELGVVHVGRPSVSRAGFAVACDDADVRLRHGLVVALGALRIEISKLVKLGLSDRKNIDDVAGVARTDLDADRIGEDEMREPRR